MVKRIKAEFPYDSYWLYKIWHKKEGRWQANLISINDHKIRTTVSYARYIVSVSIKRMLLKDEHVDHINNDKSDDRIENLQILSPNSNREKYQKYYSERNPKYTQLTCFNCSKEFFYLSKNYKFSLNKGRVNFFCSRKCVHESFRNN